MVLLLLPLGFFSVLFLFLVVEYNTWYASVCVCVWGGCFLYVFLGVLRATWICGFVSVIIFEHSQSLSLQTFLLPYVRTFDILPQLLVVFFLYFSSFCFYLSNFYLQVHLSLSSLICSSAVEIFLHGGCFLFHC